MENKSNMKFEHENLGEISFGPTHKLVCSLVKYRTSDCKLHRYCDLRVNSYNATKNRYMFSKKGITIPKVKVQEVIEVLNSLPMEPPEGIPIDENKILCTIDKHRDLKICISLTQYDGGPKVDIREYIIDKIRTYSGPTYKGVRFSYDLISQVSNMLQLCHNKLFDTKEDVDIVT